MENDNKSGGLDIADSMLTQFQIESLFTGDGDGGGKDEAGGDAGGKAGANAGGNKGGAGDGANIENKPTNAAGDGGVGNVNEGADGDAKGVTVDVNSLFGGQESVGGGDSDKEGGDAAGDGQGSSPKDTGFYSSIARAFKNDGIFLSLEDKDIDATKDSEDFRKLVESEIQARVGARIENVREAIGNGADPQEVRDIDNTLGILTSIDDKALAQEDEEGMRLRATLILNDLMERGFDEGKARRLVEASFKAGDDVADAKEALSGLIRSYTEQYESLISEGRQRADAAGKAYKESMDKLYEAVVRSDDYLGGLKPDEATRKRVFENIQKPVWEDRRTGRKYTRLQLYQRDHPQDFLKNVSFLFEMTDGFKSIERLVGGKVRKEVRNSLKDLEGKLNSTSRTSDGNLNFMGGNTQRSGMGLEGNDWDIAI